MNYREIYAVRSDGSEWKTDYPDRWDHSLNYAKDYWQKRNNATWYVLVWEAMDTTAICIWPGPANIPPTIKHYPDRDAAMVAARMSI